ncbi:MAG: ATP-grasp domain-containing protein [Caulobacteraceae bacterium]
MDDDNCGGESDADLKCREADRLFALDRIAEAKQHYLDTLKQYPNHFMTLNNFGSFLYETNFRRAAQLVLERAVSLHPDQALAHVNLANLLMYADDTARARRHCEIALEIEPGNMLAHQRLSLLSQEAGDLRAMVRHQQLGFAKAPPRILPCLGDGEPISLLLLTSTPPADLTWRKLIDRRVFTITEISPAFFDPEEQLPPHQVIFNAIGDTDLAPEALRAAQTLIGRSSAPVINAPSKALMTGRMEIARRLGSIPGVRAPRIVQMARADLTSPEAPESLGRRGFGGYPVLLRSPGFHTGRHFVRVEAPEQLSAAAEKLPGDDLLVIEHLDASRADGHHRKYRVMMIDGELYPLHLAVSADWKVHYFTGAMKDNAGFQAEERQFLENMSQALGARAMAALRAIQSSLGLDYAGVDFALGVQGEVLLFEANAVMTIVPPDPDPQWDYRRPAIEQATEAARTMLIAKARAGADRPRAAG